MCRVVLFHLVEGDDVDIKECAEELEDDVVGCEGDSVVDDIVDNADKAFCPLGPVVRDVG